MSSNTQFDKLSEEALRLAKQAKKASKSCPNIKRIQTEMGDLKESLDKTATDRLSTSQQ